MNHAELLLLIITIGHLSAGQLSFFGEIHDEGYPTFEWLTTDFADSEHKEIPRKALKEEGKEKIVLKELSKPDNIVKRNPSQTVEKNVFNPSKYYYANIKSEPNDILEPVLQKVYQEKKEDYSVPVYPEKTSLYSVHGVSEVPEVSTLPTSHRYQPLNVLEPEDKGHQYSQEKYNSNKVRDYLQLNYGQDRQEEDTRNTAEDFYSLKNFEEENQFIFGKSQVGNNGEPFRGSYTNLNDHPKERFSGNSNYQHKQVKKSAQFPGSGAEAEHFNSFLEEFQQNPSLQFPSFDFASSFPQFNDGAKFFQNDENSKIFHLHQPEAEPFVHF